MATQQCWFHPFITTFIFQSILTFSTNHHDFQLVTVKIYNSSKSEIINDIQEIFSSVNISVKHNNVQNAFFTKILNEIEYNFQTYPIHSNSIDFLDDLSHNDLSMHCKILNQELKKISNQNTSPMMLIFINNTNDKLLPSDIAIEFEICSIKQHLPLVVNIRIYLNNFKKHHTNNIYYIIYKIFIDSIILSNSTNVNFLDS